MGAVNLVFKKSYEVVRDQKGIVTQLSIERVNTSAMWLVTGKQLEEGKGRSAGTKCRDF